MKTTAVIALSLLTAFAALPLKAQESIEVTADEKIIYIAQLGAFNLGANFRF